MHIYYSSTRNSASYKPGYHRQIQDLNYNYNRYSHMRRNTELAQPHLDYQQYLNRLDMFYHDREELYRQLEVESINTSKSKKLIEQITEQNKRKKKIIDEIESKRGYSSKKTLASNQSVSKISKHFQRNMTEARQDDSILMKDKMTKNTKADDKGKRKTEQHQLQQGYKSKKYDFQSRRVESNKFLKSSHEGSAIKKQVRQVQTLQQQIEFLKKQINEKNQRILELECSLVGQEKVNKRLGKLMDDMKQKEDQKRQNLKFISKQTNVAIKGKALAQKKKLSFERLATFKIEPWEQKSFDFLFEKKFKEKVEEIKRKGISIQIQTMIQNPQSCENKTKRAKANSCQKQLQMESNTLCWSIQFAQKHEYQDIDLTLSMSHYPHKIQGSQKLCQSVDELCVFQEQPPKREEKQTQTLSLKVENNQTQTSDNYFDYIENTYLDWMFEKQYQQLVAKKNLPKVSH